MQFCKKCQIIAAACWKMAPACSSACSSKKLHPNCMQLFPSKMTKTACSFEKLHAAFIYKLHAVLLKVQMCFCYGNLKNVTAWSLKQFLLHKTKPNICNILTVKIKHLKQTNLLLMDVITNCGKTKGSYVIKWTLVTQHSTSKILLKTAKFTFTLL